MPYDIVLSGDDIEDSVHDGIVSHSEMVDLIGCPDEMIVCGGEFPRCERNFMQYIHENYARFDRRFYIPELSVILPKDLPSKNETKENLKGIGFNPISVEEALEIIKSPLQVS